MNVLTRRFYNSINETHKPFDIRCKTCNGNIVWLEDTLQFSRKEGVAGSLKLVCENCSAEYTIINFE